MSTRYPAAAMLAIRSWQHILSTVQRTPAQRVAAVRDGMIATETFRRVMGRDLLAQEVMSFVGITNKKEA